MPQSMPEYALTRNYLELIVELPWNKSTKDCLDICAAQVLLDSDHYAMEKLKKRVLEYLAVHQLKNNLKRSILCFVGPSGMGKTSVGHSIAKTLGREFHRITLGECATSLTSEDTEPYKGFTAWLREIWHPVCATAAGLTGGMNSLVKRRREKVLESLSSTADLALPLKMPIVMDRHTLKDILGLPIFEMQGCHAKPQDNRVHMLTSKLSKPAV
ncbi:UNVERIFIED_CONTAM: hypothetical protein FKN15_014901 [Acipenser sinensis]